MTHKFLPSTWLSLMASGINNTRVMKDESYKLPQDLFLFPFPLLQRFLLCWAFQQMTHSTSRYLLTPRYDQNNHDKWSDKLNNWPSNSAVTDFRASGSFFHSSTFSSSSAKNNIHFQLTTDDNYDTNYKILKDLKPTKSFLYTQTLHLVNK